MIPTRLASRLLPLIAAAAVEAVILGGLVLQGPPRMPVPQPELLRVTLVPAPDEEAEPAQETPPLPALGNGAAPMQLPAGTEFAAATKAAAAPPSVPEQTDSLPPPPAAKPVRKAPPRTAISRPKRKPPLEAREETAQAQEAASPGDRETPSIDVQWKKKDETTLALNGEMPPAASAGQSTAIYSVTVGDAGDVRGVEVLRSSGTSALDAAGENMIRTSMPFDPPRGAQDGAVAIVTIRFVWDPS